MRELAELVAQAIGYQGTPRKLLDVLRMRHPGWLRHIDVDEGIALVHRDFLARGEIATVTMKTMGSPLPRR